MRSRVHNGPLRLCGLWDDKAWILTDYLFQNRMGVRGEHETRGDQILLISAFVTLIALYIVYAKMAFILFPPRYAPTLGISSAGLLGYNSSPWE